MSILSRLGNDVANESAIRIKDIDDKKTGEMHTHEVLNDMIFLIRECRGKKYLK